MDAAAFYEQFFQSKEWFDYLKKLEKKKRMERTGEAHILTPYFIEHIPYFYPSSAKEITDGSLSVSEIDAIFELLKNSPNNSNSRSIKLYIHYLRYRVLPHSISFRDDDDLGEALECSPWDLDELVCEIIRRLYLDGMMDVNAPQSIKTLKYVVYEVIKAAHLKRVPNSYWAIEWDTRHFSGDDPLSPYIRWHYEREYLGVLTKTDAGKYYLDGIEVGKKDKAKNKILACVEMLNAESHRPIIELSRADSKCCIEAVYKRNTETKKFFRAVEKSLLKIIRKEMRAIGLMRDILGRDVLEKLFQDGYLCVEREDGSKYRINLNGEVFSLPDERYICLWAYLEDPCPLVDEILAKYIFLRDAPDAELKRVLNEAQHWRDNWWEREDKKIDYEEENKARKNASYDLDIDGRIIALSLEDQGERVN